MSTRDQMSSAITPGSLPYGERGAFEEGLPSGAAPPAPMGGPAPVSSPNAAPPLNPMGAIGALLGGVIPSDPSIPQTAGLPHGPGPGPGNSQAEPASPQSTYTERLRTIASEARSPLLRSQARAALKMLYARGHL